MFVTPDARRGQKLTPEKMFTARSLKYEFSLQNVKESLTDFFARSLPSAEEGR